MLRDQSQIEEYNVESLSEEIHRFSSPLQTAADLDPLLDCIGESRFVLLGEASHGT